MLRTGKKRRLRREKPTIIARRDDRRIEREAFEHAIKDQHFGEWAMRSTGGEYENEIVRKLGHLEGPRSTRQQVPRRCAPRLQLSRAVRFGLRQMRSEDMTLMSGLRQQRS